MKTHRRGLGRGLEVLLAEPTSAGMGTGGVQAATPRSSGQAPDENNARLREHCQALRREAEDLNKLLTELKDLLAADNN